jgi:hypothetical protein
MPALVNGMDAGTASQLIPGVRRTHGRCCVHGPLLRPTNGGSSRRMAERNEVLNGAGRLNETAFPFARGAHAKGRDDAGHRADRPWPTLGPQE